MSLSEVYFYTRRRLIDSIAPALLNKTGRGRDSVYLYSRRLTPAELQLLFPSLETHVHECVLLVDISKGEIIPDDPHGKISFDSHDVDKTIMRGNKVFFSPHHKKMYYTNSRQRKSY